MNTADFKPLRIVAVLIATWFATYAAWSRVGSADVTRYYFRRFEAIRNEVEKIPFEPGTVAFVGPSDVALNVSPRQIKAQLPGEEVYNFGVVMATPDAMRALSGELRHALTQRGKRIDVAVVRFLPMMFTRRAREIVSPAHYSLFTYTIPFGRLLAKAGWRDLGYLAHVLYLKVVGGGVAEGDWQLILYHWLDRHVNDGNPVAEGSFYTGLWRPETVAPGGEYWAESAGGEIDFYSASRDLSGAILAHRADVYATSLVLHRFLFDPLTFDFDGRYFRDFDAAIDDLGSIARKVVVYYLPDYYEPGPVHPDAAAIERLGRALERLRRDRRFTFWDYSSFPMTQANFFDIAHMTRQGKEELNRRLARSLRELEGK